MKLLFSVLQRRKWLIGVTLVSLLVIVTVAGAFRATSSYYNFSLPDSSEKANFSDLRSQHLKNYYVSSGGKDVEVYKTFDQNGIPVVHYYDISDDAYYNPVTISQYALENWEMYIKTRNEKYRNTFLKQADWLLEHQSNGRWEYSFSLKRYRLKPPWASGMAQGQGISVLLRAYQITGQQEYLLASRHAFALLQTTTKEGGVMAPGAGTWFEEYPSNPPSYVLNGHMWALFGIYDYYRVTKEKVALRLFDQGIQTLLRKLNSFDTGYWILYDLYDGNNFVDRLVDRHYAHFQVEQLKILFALTKEPAFGKAADRWNNYQVSKWNRIKFGFTILPYKFWDRLKQTLPFIDEQAV